jgi:hypothetical protein
VAFVHTTIQLNLADGASFPTPKVSTLLSPTHECIALNLEAVAASILAGEYESADAITVHFMFDPHSPPIKRLEKALEVSTLLHNNNSKPKDAPPKTPDGTPPARPANPTGTTSADTPCFSWMLGKGTCATAALNSVCPILGTDGKPRPHCWHASHTPDYQAKLKKHISSRFPDFGKLKG